VIEQINVVSSRRAYEFAADTIRLTVLTTKPVLDAIQGAFHFQIAQVGSPIRTFGDVPATIPPGVVCDYGIWITPDEQAVPIRFVHIEPRRIVIDVVGASSLITPIYERLRQVVDEVCSVLHLADDRPAFGEPERAIDFSEVTMKCSWSLDAIFAPQVRDLFAHAAAFASEHEGMMLVPTLIMRPNPADRESSGADISLDSRALQLAPRMGTRFEDQVHYSGALLDSEAHLAYLRQLDAVLSSR